MVKCEVIKKCCIVVEVESVVYVTEEQLKYASNNLKPIEEKVVKAKKKDVNVK